MTRPDTDAEPAGYRRDRPDRTAAPYLTPPARPPTAAPWGLWLRRRDRLGLGSDS